MKVKATVGCGQGGEDFPFSHPIRQALYSPCVICGGGGEPESELSGPGLPVPGGPWDQVTECLSPLESEAESLALASRDG